MNLLLDTNVVYHLSKDPALKPLREFINPNNQKIFISIISIGELKAIALQNNWGYRRQNIVKAILEESIVVEINENLADTYAQIDAYSQRRNPAFSNYSFDTPRNMGKNDLWLAATAALLGLKLVTTDGDFNHLHNEFLEVQLIKPEVFS